MYSFRRINTLGFLSSLQGEKGDAGLPGPIGPQGIPVSVSLQFNSGILHQDASSVSQKQPAYNNRKPFSKDEWNGSSVNKYTLI